MEELIRVENVTKCFAGHTALDNVSLSIPRGAVYGLLGPNGAGKTTLIRIINRITAPDSGKVWFNGHPLSPEDVPHIGYLPEERGLYKTMKVGASVAVARRGGCTATFDQLNKYFTISGMPVASGQYWNSVHGRKVGEAVGDEEGLQGMRTLAENMSFLIKSIALGKEKYGIPEKEKWIMTNFVR